MARINGSVGTTRGFIQAVNKWTKETEQRSEKAFQNTALEFYDSLSAATPVKSGNLRNSLIASVNGPSAPTVTGPGTDNYDSTYRGGAEQSISNILSAKLGDKISYVYSATYAMRVNYGFVGYDSIERFYNQQGRFWIEAVGAQYRSIARRVATALRLQSK